MENAPNKRSGCAFLFHINDVCAVLLWIMTRELRNEARGFTLIELLVVIAIVAIFAAIVLFAVNQARIKGIDAGRKSEAQELVKAFELYYADNGRYPFNYQDVDPQSGTWSSQLILYNIKRFASLRGPDFFGNKYFAKLPPDQDKYAYCVTVNTLGNAYTIGVDTEDDKGGSPYCTITGGNGTGLEGFGCTTWLNAMGYTPCSDRF